MVQHSLNNVLPFPSKLGENPKADHPASKPGLHSDEAVDTAEAA